MVATVHPQWESAADAMAKVIDSGDREAALALYADDVVVWHNYDQVEIGRDQLIASTLSLIRAVPDLRVEVVLRAGTPTGFVQQQVFRGQAPGGELALHSCVVVTVTDDGRISRLDEYLDTTQSRVLRPPKA